MYLFQLIHLYYNKYIINSLSKNKKYHLPLFVFKTEDTSFQTFSVTCWSLYAEYFKTNKHGCWLTHSLEPCLLPKKMTFFKKMVKNKINKIKIKVLWSTVVRMVRFDCLWSGRSRASSAACDRRTRLRRYRETTLYENSKTSTVRPEFRSNCVSRTSRASTAAS